MVCKFVSRKRSTKVCMGCWARRSVYRSAGEWILQCLWWLWCGSYYTGWVQTPSKVFTMFVRPITSTQIDNNISFIQSDRHWQHTNSHSSEYGKRIPFDNRSYSFEHVQRYSVRLLAALHRAGLDGMHAWSEQAACSICQLNSLRFERLKSEHLGQPFTFKHRATITSENDLNNRASKPNMKNKWIHPVKFW